MPRKIYARNTIAVPLDTHTAISFIDDNHRQGMTAQHPNMHSYGLYHKEDTEHNELLGVVAFCSPRTPKKRLTYKWELLRLCSPEDVVVVGGASKLIKMFIREKNPVNFFTYQDTSGESSDVYALSGMTLIQDAQDKKVLVKDGLTYKTAQNNRRDWFSLQQASTIGPDKLLGTTLGEIHDENGTRLSNVRLFTEHCGYHLEIVPGDRVYEWHNERVYYYTYRISASDSEKYYLGRKTHMSIHGDTPSEQELLSDGYYGSGGAKYSHWKARHQDTLQKEILGVYTRWGDSVQEEKRLIGDLYKTDPLCLNSVPGGVGTSGGTHKREYKIAHCEKHGDVLHSRNGCCHCFNSSTLSMQNCEIHGETPFRSGTCCKCTTENAYHKDVCPIHGNTVFTSKGCYKCTSQHHKVEHCGAHGNTLHSKNGVCLVCAASNRKNTMTMQHCDVHGDTMFRGNTCLKCSLMDTYRKDHCVIHGDTKHKNGNCVACTNTTSFNIDVARCDKHGDTKHVDHMCYECLLDNNPQYASLVNSHVVCDNTKNDVFTCPECDTEIHTTMNKIIMKIIPLAHNTTTFTEGDNNMWTAEICPSCASYVSFLTKNKTAHEAVKLVKGWDNIKPRIVSKKDTRVIIMVCPECDTQRDMKFSSLVAAVQRGYTLCKTCGYKHGE